MITARTTRSRFAVLVTLLVVSVVSVVSVVARADGPATRTESFDRDPGWEALNNRIVPEKVHTVTQDFGYSPATAFANDAPGEIGGRVTRAAQPAYCAAKIDPRTFHDKLSASGTLAVTKSGAASGIFFGWFDANHLPEGSGRPPSSLGIEIGGENAGGRMAVRAHTVNNLSAGKFVTKFEPYRTKEQQPIMRPTELRNDGTRYAWTLDYDPGAAGGNGQVRFTIKSNLPTPAHFENKVISFDLPEGFKEAGATFDRFGLLNGTKPGGPMTIYFDDLRYDGKEEDFSKDPGWIESASRATYQPTVLVGMHNFGFSAETNHAAGAAAGEIGGDLWRGGKYGYYADPRIGPVSFDDALEASGKVVLLVGAPDSDMYLGWFDSAARHESPAAVGSFIGVHVGGPTRVGHYFHPSLMTARRMRNQSEAGPLLTPGKTYDFVLRYDPAASDGNGAIEVKLGDESVTLPLKKGVKSHGGKLDRFGLFTSTTGGQLVRIYLDDLKYTARRAQ